MVCCISPGCKRNDPGGVIISINVSIAYSDSEHADLLNPAHPDCIKAGDIEIYYLENGEKHLAYNSWSDAPYGFRIIEGPGGRFYLASSVGIATDKNGISTTYIAIKNRSEDTLTALINKRGGGRITTVDKVWLNGKLVWETGGDSSAGGATFEIIK